MATLTLQPGASGEDTFLRSDLVDTNSGGSQYMFVGELQGAAEITRTLLRFDLSSLPTGANIASTTLTLTIANDWSANARTFRVYRSKREWVEGEATWNSYSTGNAWQTAGGFGANDCEQTDIGSRAMSASESGAVDFSITATTKTDLDYGLEQAGNATGWLIKADTEANDAYSFYTSERTTASQRPKLVIVYYIDPVASTLSGRIKATRNHLIRR